tara:strand:- start:47 stop:1369 length:1323 start_codon:yes stop_codon:yes gene_type:complete
MKKTVKYFFFLISIVVLTGCGTREFLGFEKKKIKLPGKRIAILKEENNENIPILKSKIEVVLDESSTTSDWLQSNSSANHLSINHLSDSKLEVFKTLVSGKGETKNSKILTQPVIYKNNIFFLDAKSNVISFDLIEKRIIWKKNISSEGEKNHDIGGGLAIYKDTLIINSPYRQIISLDIESGEVIWVKDIESALRSSPTIYDNKLLSLTLGNKLYALNAESGDLLWEHQGLFNNTTLMSSPKVAIDENIVIVPYSNGDFFALNLNNGREIWRNSFIDLEVKETTNTFTDIDAFPVIKRDMVFMTSAVGKLSAINKKTGNKFWTKDIFSTQTPAVNGNNIFIINKNKELICLNIIDGGVKWSLNIDEGLSDQYRYRWMAPILINSKLIIVGGEKKLIIIDPFNGSILSIKKMPSFPTTSPLVVGGKLYLMLKNGAVVSIE